MNPDGLARIERLNYALTALLAAFAWLVAPWPVALGLVVGAFITSLNISAIRSLIQRLFRGSQKGKAGAALLMLPKMLAVMAAAYAALRFLPIDPVAFAVGFSLFFVSIAVETVRFVLNGGGSDSTDSAPAASPSDDGTGGQGA